MFSWRDSPMYFRFIGRDGSMGYRTGRVYHLGVSWHKTGDYQNGLTIHVLGIKGLFGRRYCPYKNEDKFWENWEPAR